MTNRQSQQVSDNSTAIQATGDVSVGITPEQMLAIMGEIRNTVHVYGEQSQRLIEERFASFENRVLEKFKSDSSARPDAFADPDFQYVVREAQKSFARSGDASLEDVLIDLVAERSKSEVRNRLTLTLNDAVEKAGSLTSTDFDNLAQIFIFQNVQNNAATNLRHLQQVFSEMFFPIYENASGTEMDFSYLGTHNCIVPGTDGPISSLDSYAILKQRYPGALFRGVSIQELESVIPVEHPFWLRKGVVPSAVADDLFVCIFGTEESIAASIAQTGVPAVFGSQYVELAKQHPMSRDEFIAASGEHSQRVSEMLDRYDLPYIKNSRLTSLGVALAHARMAKIELFDAPLSVWIN